MIITEEQKKELVKNAYWRGFKASALIFGSVAVLVFVIMANIVIYVGN